MRYGDRNARPTFASIERQVLGYVRGRLEREEQPITVHVWANRENKRTNAFKIAQLIDSHFGKRVELKDFYG